jgi:putative ABC transport system permease protein
MFRNYLITALRNFTRHKLYSFINVAGLTVGLTCAIFIVLFVRYQLSYDRWIPGSGSLYRVEITANNPGQLPLHFAGASFPIAHAMLQQLPEIKAATVLTPEDMTVISGNRQFAENVDVVDPNFLDVVKLPLVEGDPAALRRPDAVVISESAAKKYFGTADPIGKTLTMSGKPWYGSDQTTRQENMVVKGVMRDLPANSQLSGDFLLPNNSKADLMPDEEKRTWGNINSYGYVALAPGATVAQLMPKLDALVDRSVADMMRTMHVNLKGSVILAPTLTPFWDVHLSTDRYGGMTPAGSWATVYGFAVIGVLILLVACFNFTNLATARAMIRAREISLRKVMGAGRRQLILQFLGESVLTALIALVLALALVEVLLPLFDRLLDAPIRLSYSGDWQLVLAACVMAVWPVAHHPSGAPVRGLDRPGDRGPGGVRTGLLRPRHGHGLQSRQCGDRLRGQPDPRSAAKPCPRTAFRSGHRGGGAIHRHAVRPGNEGQCFCAVSRATLQGQFSQCELRPRLPRALRHRAGGGPRVFRRPCRRPLCPRRQDAQCADQ